MKAPDFSLPDQKGIIHKLQDYRGSWLLVYFYPKDDTPGCTKEACSFRDNSGTLEEHGIKVVGISADTVDSHKQFSDKYSLPFPLLSDPDTTVIKAYEAWEKKKFMGKEHMGVIRISYLINPDGEITKKYPEVKPENHAEEIISDVKKFSFKS